MSCCSGCNHTLKNAVLTCKPFKTLDEVYAKINQLDEWPEIRDLQEVAEYVFRGSELTGQGSSGVLEKLDRDKQPRTLVCHDMKGGYLEDRWINGGTLHDSYIFYHWSMIDTFVYFSHHTVTIPPYGWINAAHTHGVKILGTFITEWDRGKQILADMFRSDEEIKKFADALIKLAQFYKFDGWLLNVENAINAGDVDKMKFFVKYLTDGIHARVDGSEIIWYDSVTCKGVLSWQNQLNDSNKCFFDLCDGIFLNYNWTESGLLASRMKALEDNRVHDVYVGIDVWGRGCPGGGGLNSDYALEKIREHNLSVAIFAPGWTHERFGPSTFEKLENLFWAQLTPRLYIHVPMYENETFVTSFCRGAGTQYHHLGEPKCSNLVVDGTNSKGTSFYNLSAQKHQVSVPTPHLVFMKNQSTSDTLPTVSESNLLTKNFTEIVGEIGVQTGEPKKEKSSPDVYETKQEIIRVDGQAVTFESKGQDLPGLNYFEFCGAFSFNGGGCLKLVTRDPKIFHRLFLVQISFEHGIEVSVVYKKGDSKDTSAENEPLLILGNDTGLKLIRKYDAKELDHQWRRNVYVTDLMTVIEIGVAFAKEGICHLGEIVVKQKGEWIKH